ncbi:MAG: helix-turn-helix transcriptional regulator [Myxococcales bacterium]|jgi:AraC-like DNA-binding protein|nr:helix-turn-helix transcriptional regulator [Myxococcales bacterium]
MRAGERYEGPITLVIERGAKISSARRVEHRPAVVLALGSSVVDLAFGDDTARLDRSCVVLVPARVAFRVVTVSPVTELLTLALGDAVLESACAEYRPHVDAALFADVLSRATTLPRTRWVDEIAQRYLFERAVCEKHRSRAARFLETEIAKEIYFLGKEHLEEHTRDSVVRTAASLAEEGRRLIEARLFEPLRVGALARSCHVSESTLLRAFRAEIGVAPGTYLRERRLDEALLLLESGELTASEVAAKVGYADLAAFTVAFQRRFGVPPSATRKLARRALAGRLPPAGEPPTLTESHKTLTGSRKAGRAGRGTPSAR